MLCKEEVQVRIAHCRAVRDMAMSLPKGDELSEMMRYWIEQALVVGWCRALAWVLEEEEEEGEE